MVTTTEMPALTRTDSVPKARVLRILYAEDLRDLREVARMALSRDGHTIDCVEDGMLAFDQMKAKPQAYDLLITDHHMPNMNGLELVTALQGQSHSAKIIVFSSELSPVVSAAYLALGVKKILPKPIFPSELRQVLAEIFPAAPEKPTAH
jgi:CheY-like chemotaxis protein